MVGVQTGVGGINGTYVPESGRCVTRAELAAASGVGGASLWVAIRDVGSFETTVFDVSSAANFYGPGGPYELFAGKDASHGLATGSLAPADVTASTDNLDPPEIQALMGWHAKFLQKYPRVGYLERT
eukprot:CAMPEP_0185831040 /NCGR_PEP_ID=MMETSP1353-20130828/1248_1 /TAXON_ID=1077150 /ORGANISM="Erythrolobus australicus, Strain CCMP3124" /LENGTH=126 /DNA_ID=CAMNT_0028529055 /DNA_START=225 /DNA_END=605 /DNA_ORIENTATION=+